MDLIFKNFETSFNSNITDVKNEYYKLNNQIKELENNNDVLKEENRKLSNIIEELNKEKKAKASSTIWESMNTKLSEKDIIIEQLKKDIEFYKRTCPKSNITEKWQQSTIKSNSCDLIESPINLTDLKQDIKQEVKQNIKQDIKTDIENIEMNDNNIDITNTTEDTVFIKKSKDKTKDKLKDKTKDKSKKKKKNIKE